MRIDVGVPLLQFPCALPPDVRGVPHGPDYIPLNQYNKDATMATGHGFTSIKSGRFLSALGWAAASVLHMLQIEPSVLDAREEYPACDLIKVAEARRSGRRLRRTEMLTLDILATMRSASSREGVRYVAYFIRPPEKLGSPGDERRIRRELRFCQSMNWSWYYLGESAYRGWHAVNARNLSLRLLNAGASVASMRDAALELSAILHRSTYTTLRTALTLSGRSLRVDVDRAYTYFAAAVAYGFLRPEMSRPLALEKPLFLRGTAC